MAADEIIVVVHALMTCRADSNGYVCDYILGVLVLSLINKHVTNEGELDK